MTLPLIFVPLAFALIAFFAPSDVMRRWLVPLSGAAHLALTLVAITSEPRPELDGWLLLDPLGRIFLLQTSVVYFGASLYAPRYLEHFAERPNRLFVTCVVAFQGPLSLLVVSHHLGLMWVALETLTLTAAPLVYFNRNARSLEATWKYLLIGSVGIAIALLGSFFLAYSALKAGLETTLLFDDLVVLAPHLSKPWLEAGFVLLFVGYGTKMGLAPMHTWKPDAYGEAPGFVGTLLAGCVTSGAFLAILRFFQVLRAAGSTALAEELMIGTGLFSMILAGAFMTRQRDFKRMLAYSSVEHVGILVLGVGLGGGATVGALLHLFTNSVTKGVMFLSAGNIHRIFGSKLTAEVHGALRHAPASAVLLLTGFIAITGSPPFGVFLSELTILRAALDQQRSAIASVYVV
ncbi:hydrogenase, partial [Myxococcota bacterium]|nr:hydrogenase [Myxococcota bacterium]